MSAGGDIARTRVAPPRAPSGVVEETLPAVGREDAADPGMPSGATQTVKPLPAWERHLPKVYVVLLALAVLGLAFFPSVANDYSVTLALTVLLTVCLASSWNIISGFSGYVSFGHAGFFGIGAYTGALLIYHDTVPWILAVLAAGVGTALVALLIGYPTLRLRGPYFAITMLGLSELARIVVTAWDSLTFGGSGVYLPILYERSERLTNYYAMLILAVLVVLVSYTVGTSAFGLRLLAIRDDEGAAQAMGVNTTGHKIAAFTLSSFFPGAAGAIYARHNGYIDPPTFFAVIWSIRAISTSILGGQGTILGPIIGAVVLTLVSEQVWALDPNAYQIIFGALIVLVVLFMPGGLIALGQRWGWLLRSRRL